MASTMTIKVHPVVYMTIVDSFLRRSRPQPKSNQPSNDKAVGTLMGYYEKDGVQITNCFAVPFAEKSDDVEIDDSFNTQMIQQLRRAAPNEEIVGWFCTVADLSPHCLTYHDYYMRVVSETSARKESPPLVLLTLDTTFSEQGDEKYRMPVRAYLRSKAGIPGGSDAHCAIFHPIRVELDAYPGESVAMQLIQNALDSRRREASMENGLEQLERSTSDIIGWLERLLQYVNGVLARDELPADATMGRRLMDIVNTATTHMQTDKLDSLIKNSLRDYMMISYLASLTKTQLQVHERMVNI